MKTNLLMVASVMLLSICMLCATSASAQQVVGSQSTAPNAGPGIGWQQLSVEQQKLLSGMQGKWSQLPPGRQIALANGARRFLKMDAEQRQQANGRFGQWNSMSDEERTDIGRRFNEFRRLPPHEKARIRQAAGRFRNLTPEQRQRLRQRFQELTPEQRRELWRNRPRPRQQ